MSNVHAALQSEFFQSRVCVCVLSRLYFYGQLRHFLGGIAYSIGISEPVGVYNDILRHKGRR